MTAKQIVAYDNKIGLLTVGEQTMHTAGFAAAGFTQAIVKAVYLTVEPMIEAIDKDNRDDWTVDSITRLVIGDALTDDKLQRYLGAVSPVAKALSLTAKIESWQDPINKYNKDNKAALVIAFDAVAKHEAALVKATGDLDAMRDALGEELGVKAMWIGYAGDSKSLYADKDTVKSGAGKTRVDVNRVYPNTVLVTKAFTTHKGVDGLSCKITGKDLDSKGKGAWSFVFSAPGQTSITSKGKTPNSAYKIGIAKVIKSWSKDKDQGVTCNVPKVFGLVPQEETK